MYCRNCGETVDAAKNMCRSCGTLRGSGEGFCPICGRELPQGRTVCGSCGADVRTTGDKGTVVPSQRRLSALVSALGTLLVPGFGQVANGQPAKGFVLLIVWMLFPMSWHIPRLGLTALAAADAYLSVSRLERGETIGKWHFF